MKIGAPARLDDFSARAIYAASCAGLLVFSLIFVLLATIEGLSVPWYEPLDRAWHLASTKPTPVSMDWFGRVAISLAFAAVASLAVFFATRRRALSASLLRAASIWALAMTVIGLFLYAWTLANRVILPPGS